MLSAVTATINLSALKSNLEVVRKHCPKSKVYAVVKANAYGHGVYEVAKALKDVDGLAVARSDEALFLRQKGIRSSILILGGVYSDIEFRRATAHNIELVVHNDEQLSMVTEASNRASLRTIRIWIKVDTGMHRLGFAPDRFADVYDVLKNKTSASQFVLITHLANADNTSDKTTTNQITRFNKIAEGLDLPCSIANSAGIVAWEASHADFVRPGIMLYGASPLLDKTAQQLGLQPVMTLSSKLIAVNRLKKGDAVGYGGDWKCPEAMPVGVVSIGYGDGYPRHAKPGTPVLVNGVRVPLIGRVSMDMICVDLREQPLAKSGDPVVLWGEGLPADEVAKYAGTIAYDLFCGVTSRVEFKYNG